jgi:glycosyltransferase involved in cell wall biosynthesis
MILFIVHIDTAETWRGGQNQALLTALGQQARGHRIVLVVHPDGELRRRAGNLLETVPLGGHGELDLRAGWQLSRLIKQWQPDVVHAHDPHGVAMGAVALSIGTPDSGPILVASRRVDFHMRGNAFSRWKCGRVTCFIAASRVIGDMLVQDGIEPTRVVAVHEGIDVDRVAQAPVANIHEAFWLPAGVPVVGNVAALVAHKGQKHLIDAAAAVIRQVPDAHFLILGEGELRPALERQVREMHLEKHVLLPGFRNDVLSLLKGFDIFVMSSVTEGLGTSLLDAMAAARPVVATRAGGIPEVVIDEETGLLVPPRDHERLAAAIVRLLRDPALRQRLARAGLDRVRAEFSVDRMVDETLAIYEQLAGTSRAAGTAGRRTDA